MQFYKTTIFMLTFCIHQHTKTAQEESQPKKTSGLFALITQAKEQGTWTEQPATILPAYPAIELTTEMRGRKMSASGRDERFQPSPIQKAIVSPTAKALAALAAGTAEHKQAMASIPTSTPIEIKSSK